MKERPHFRSISYIDHNEEIYDKLLSDLKTKISKESEEIPSNSLFKSSPKSIQNKQKYAEDLKKQIDQKTKSKLSNLPDSSSAYPDIPITPKDLKRQKIKESMNYFKKSLDEQMSLKKSEEIESKKKETEFNQKAKEENESFLAKEKTEKQEKILKQKEILTNSWNLAIQTNDLKKKLEEIGRKGASVKKERIGNALAGENSTEEVGLQNRATPNEEIAVTKTKPGKLKKVNLDERQSYQEKIQKIIKAAKNNRERYLKYFPRDKSP